MVMLKLSPTELSMIDRSPVSEQLDLFDESCSSVDLFHHQIDDHQIGVHVLVDSEAFLGACGSSVCEAFRFENNL